MPSVDPSTDALESLVERARRTLADAYSLERHRTACALRTTEDRVHAGLHLDAALGTASVHAEAGAIANACKARDDSDSNAIEIDAIVAVSYVPDDPDATIAREALLSAPVVPPCGTCRELVYEYGSDATVVVEAAPELRTASIDELLPDAPWHTEW